MLILPRYKTPFTVVSFLTTFIDSISFGSIYSIEFIERKFESKNMAGSSILFFCPKNSVVKNNMKKVRRHFIFEGVNSF
jgi:dynactin complex subunit